MTGWCDIGFEPGGWEFDSLRAHQPQSRVFEGPRVRAAQGSVVRATSRPPRLISRNSHTLASFQSRNTVWGETFKTSAPTGYEKYIDAAYDSGWASAFKANAEFAKKLKTLTSK